MNLSKLSTVTDLPYKGAVAKTKFSGTGGEGIPAKTKFSGTGGEGIPAKINFLA